MLGRNQTWKFSVVENALMELWTYCYYACWQAWETAVGRAMSVHWTMCSADQLMLLMSDETSCQSQRLKTDCYLIAASQLSLTLTDCLKTDAAQQTASQ